MKHQYDLITPKTESIQPNNVLIDVLNDINEKLADLWWSVENTGKAGGGFKDKAWMPIYVDENQRKIYLDLDDIKSPHDLRMSAAFALQITKVITRSSHLTNASTAIGLTERQAKEVERDSINERSLTNWPYLPFYTADTKLKLNADNKNHYSINGYKKRPNDIGFIPGNKKDTYTLQGYDFNRSAESLIDAGDKLRLAETFPKPNYKKLIAQSDLKGVPLNNYMTALRFLDWFRDQIRPYVTLLNYSHEQKMELTNNYLDLCRAGQHLFNDLVENPDQDIRQSLILCQTEDSAILGEIGRGSNKYNTCLLKDGENFKRAFKTIESRLNLYGDSLYDVQECDWPAAIPEWHKRYRVHKHDEVSYCVISRDPAARSIGEPTYFPTREEAQNQAKVLYNRTLLHIEPDALEGIGLAIYRVYNNLQLRRLKTGFVTKNDAYDYMDEHADDLLLMQPDNIIRPTSGVNQRRGTKRRSSDITEKKLKEDYGLDRMVFGEQMTIQDRISILNSTYDALGDLAENLSIPPKAIGLDETLSLSFGARGRGGRRAPAAHYEPGERVINLTKKSGHGALAHEWIHALDYYAGKLDTGRVVAATQQSERSTTPLATSIKDLSVRINTYNIKTKVDLLDHEITHCVSQINKVLNNLTYAYGNLKGKDGPIAKPDNWEDFIQQAQELFNCDINNFGGKVSQLIDRFYEEYEAPFKEAIPEHAEYSTELRERLIKAAHKGVSRIKEVIFKSPTEFDAPMRSRIQRASLKQDDLDNRNYWSKPLEVFARSCESMINFSMAEKGSQNTFLVSFPSGELFLTQKEASSHRENFLELNSVLKQHFSPLAIDNTMAIEQPLITSLKNGSQKQKKIFNPVETAKAFEPTVEKINAHYEGDVQKRQHEKLNTIRNKLGF